VLVVGQCGPEIAATLYRETHPDQLIVDLVNIPQKERLRGTYAGVCW
jgi:GDP-mannose 6-dehydrogenase